MSELDKQILEYKTTPYWKNGCNHGGYLFSFTCVETIKEVNKYDVYCFDGHRGQDFCLRFGDFEGDYCSPGNIKYMLSAQSLNRYRDCVTLLEEIGEIKFIKN